MIRAKMLSSIAISHREIGSGRQSNKNKKNIFVLLERQKNRVRSKGVSMVDGKGERWDRKEELEPSFC